MVQIKEKQGQALLKETVLSFGFDSLRFESLV